MDVHKNFIDGAMGQRRCGDERTSTRRTSPTSWGLYAQGGKEDVEAAVAAAERALPGWSESTPQLRFDVLDATGSEILARKAEIGRLLAREEGKTLPEGVAEVTRAGYIFKYFAGEALRTAGEHIASVRPGVTSTSCANRSVWSGSSPPGIFPSRFPRGRSLPRSPSATPSC